MWRSGKLYEGGSVNVEGILRRYTRKEWYSDPADYPHYETETGIFMTTASHL
jgi:hypothetical protein